MLTLRIDLYSSITAGHCRHRLHRGSRHQHFSKMASARRGVYSADAVHLTAYEGIPCSGKWKAAKGEKEEEKREKKRKKRGAERSTIRKERRESVSLEMRIRSSDRRAFDLQRRNFIISDTRSSSPSTSLRRGLKGVTIGWIRSYTCPGRTPARSRSMSGASRKSTLILFSPSAVVRHRCRHRRGIYHSRFWRGASRPPKLPRFKVNEVSPAAQFLRSLIEFETHASPLSR